MRIKFNILALLLLSLLLLQCAGNPKSAENQNGAVLGQRPLLNISELGDGLAIKTAGMTLMNLPMGLNRISGDLDQNDSVLVIVVHGYQSQGYEWVEGIRGLVKHFGSVYLYRYNWEKCPDLLAENLAQRVKDLQKSGSYDRVLIFGHSYGGVVLTFAAAQLGRTAAELHVIAAPLSGFPSLFDHCESLSYDGQDKLKYKPWSPDVRVIQHKTVHSQDGAFRDLAVDPQAIQLPFASIDELPPTMDGHRLGHNWSVTWVIDRYLGRFHRN